LGTVSNGQGYCQQIEKISIGYCQQWARVLSADSGNIFWLLSANIGNIFWLLSADSGNIFWLLSADTGNIFWLLSADSGNIYRILLADSVNIYRVLSADSGNIYRLLPADSGQGYCQHTVGISTGYCQQTVGRGTASTQWEYLQDTASRERHTKKLRIQRALPSKFHLFSGVPCSNPAPTPALLTDSFCGLPQSAHINCTSSCSTSVFFQIPFSSLFTTRLLFHAALRPTTLQFGLTSCSAFVTLCKNQFRMISIQRDANYIWF